MCVCVCVVCVCVRVNGTYCCSADVSGSNGRNCWSHSTEGCRTDVEAPVESHSTITFHSILRDSALLLAE